MACVNPNSIYVDGVNYTNGLSDHIRMQIGSAAGVYTSTDSIWTNSVIISTVVEIIQAYDGAAAIGVKTSGVAPSTLQATTDNNVGVINSYQVDNWLAVTVLNSGHIVCTVYGAPTVGHAIVDVEFVLNPSP